MKLRGIACILFLALHFASARAATKQHDICGYRTMSDGTIFTLDIARSFDPHVTFKLCERKDPKENFLLITTASKGRGKHSTDRRIILDESSYARMVSLYDAALNYNVKDNNMGTDGSMWCLETTRGFTYSKACFYMPDDYPKNRGLSGLATLGEELWRFAKMEPIVGKLY
jgi:hypothetical protein